MMVTTRTYRPGGFGRAAPGRRLRRWATRLALVALALTTFGIEGCSSLGLGGGGGMGGGCSSCGRPRCCGLRRLFSRPAVVGGYEPGLGVGVPIEAPPAAVAAPPTVIQTPAPASEVPELTVPPEPATPSSPPPGGGNGGGASTNPGPAAMLRPGRAVYQAQIDRSPGGPSTARRGLAARGRTPRPMATPTTPTQRNDVPPPADDPLANLSLHLDAPPPVDPKSAAAPESAAAPRPVESPAPAETGSSAEAAKPDEPAAPTTAGVVSLTPGIKWFKSVRPKLAGGSLPDATGWDWLGGKIGYKAVLDLRDPSEIRPEDLAAINHQGLRYIMLPVNAETLDEARVKRFLAELEQVGDQPLYFFDTDGSKASVMWYLHRVLIEKDTREAAASEAEQVGPRVATLWEAASRYLDLHPPADPASSPVPSEPKADPVPTSAATVPQVATTPLPTDAPATPDDPASTDPEESPAATDLSVPTEPADRAAWRSYAALILTGLGIPLAYLGRSAINHGLRFRASLPAPARRPRELPSESGA